MDSRTPERAPTPELNATTPELNATPEAIEFVRFCRHRRSVGWPELYDEMCAVAGRGLYRGWGADELGAHGIGFSLFDMPRLAVLVQRVIADEREVRSAALPSARPAAAAAPIMSAPGRLETSEEDSDELSPGGSRRKPLVSAGV